MHIEFVIPASQKSYSMAIGAAKNFKDKSEGNQVTNAGFGISGDDGMSLSQNFRR